MSGHAVSRPPLVTSDGVSLEVIIDHAQSATGSVVVCHPHPEHGGTMRHPMLVAIMREALERGIDVIRFNFRGVGGSEGRHGGGQAEILDIDAAVGLAHHSGAEPLGIVGWSFGAATALVWQAEKGSDLSYVGIAPPVASPLTPPLPAPGSLAPAARTFIIGDRDQFVDADELVDYAASIAARVIRYETADHFFLMRHDRLAVDVLDAIGGS
ncbi:MAG TPA: alpha/beta fold hydrolase [Acidimicrobiia bacterium]|nr:alpha/beta fold hydrolase [Acidimicrobiia bacterium]